MEIDLNRKEIKLSKKINGLDRFVLDFCSLLKDYVIVSGYVSILLGRSRASEDIDLLIPKMPFEKFSALFEDLMSKGYECANTSDVKEAYEMWDEYAMRFYKKNPLPNIEFKMITKDIQRTAFEERIKVILGEKVLYISSLELQIAYKLSLISQGDFEEISSDKDFEDAKHLYELFRDKLNKDKLIYYVRSLGVEEKWKWLQI